MAKKYFLIEIKVKAEDGLPDWGLGEGILATQTMAIEEEELENPLSSYSLVRQGEQMLKEVVEINISPI